MLRVEGKTNTCIFGSTRSQLESTIYHTRSEHTFHYTNTCWYIEHSCICLLLSWAENAIFAYFSSACFIYSLLYTRYRTMYTPNDFFMSSYNNFSSTCNSRLMYKIFCKILDKCKNVQCINKCWCNGKCVRFECGRSWIRAAIESNQRLYIIDTCICCLPSTLSMQPLWEIVDWLVRNQNYYWNDADVRFVLDQHA
jgi:hypothetical protein